MSKEILPRRLRPHLFSAYTRSQCCTSSRAFASSPWCHDVKKQTDVTHDYEKRVAQLDARKPLSQSYPRIEDGGQWRRATRVTRQDLEGAEEAKDNASTRYTVAGMMSMPAMHSDGTDADCFKAVSLPSGPLAPS